jgi:S-layer homology domain
MTSNPILRLRRAAGLGAVLVLAGTVAANANSVRVPNGGTPEGPTPCAAANPNGARFSQSCGAQVSVSAGDATPAYVQDNSPAGEATYRTRFYINLRTLQMANADRFEVFAAYDGADPVPPASAGNAVLKVVVQQTAGVKELVLVARTDSGTEIESAAFPLFAGWRSIELDWAKATAAGANNGRLGLWIDGAVKTGVTALDNDTLSLNYSRWGALNGLDAGTSGTFRMDDFSSQRTGYIGPAFPFSDNPTSSGFFPFIQGIYANEIIPECALGSFCPAGNITRKEMSKFLLLARNGANFVPPACPTPTFTDVPCSHPYATWIYEMARLGITSGCAPNLFCPEGTVTRNQMAVFLLVAAGVSPPPCPPATFADVPSGSSFCPWVNEIAARGITAGCGGGNFCPADLVSRAQMSVFLTQTFLLPKHIVGP